jgi:3-mercaptopyruvate sulfurtransferase SseA
MFTSSFMVHITSLVKRKVIVYDDSHIDSGDSGMAAKAKPRDWQAKVKGALKAELKRRNLSYADLAEKLAAIGVDDNERNISNKISRGTFTAVFFVQCLEAIGCHTVRLDEA